MVGVCAKPLATQDIWCTPQFKDKDKAMAISLGSNFAILLGERWKTENWETVGR